MEPKKGTIHLSDTPRRRVLGMRVQPSRHLLLLGLITLMVILAWHTRFIEDDAFISFRYAANWVAGKGLVFNAGERVEGYTNFAWTVLMALPLQLGLDPVRFTFWLGMSLFAGTLVLTYWSARYLVRNRMLRLAVVLLLGTNYTFSAYATGGMETQLQTLCVMAATGLLLGGLATADWSRRRLLGLSLVGALATLTRLDSTVLVGAMIAATGIRILGEQARPITQKGARLLWLFLPFLIIVGAWLGWKWSYYGALLPNTFYAKVAGSEHLGAGLRYLWLFLRTYWLLPFPLLVGLALIKARRFDLRIMAPGVAILLWGAYLIQVGGDFMEFRFLVPILPLIMLLVVWALETLFGDLPRGRWLQAAAVGFVLIGSLSHRLTFPDSRLRIRLGVETISQLEDHLYAPDENWVGIGKSLGLVFHDEAQVTLATTAVGAIPYYAELPTVDMLGLNDPWIARHGPLVGQKSGHQRRPTLNYLLQRQTHLVLGHPWIQRIDDPLAKSYSLQDRDRLAIRFNLVVEDWDRVPRGARIIEIPIGRRYILSVLYLVPHPAVDAAIIANRWQTYPVWD
jgi:hypothetical protein